MSITFRKISINKWQQFENINLDLLYLTDASKVYKNGNREKREFDKERSRNLLSAEIELCEPDMIILL